MLFNCTALCLVLRVYISKTTASGKEMLEFKITFISKFIHVLTEKAVGGFGTP